MIEMLGVLAIIGVLSIGGIALYRRAVNNHHANTILDDVNRFAFAIIEKGNYPLEAVIPKGDFKESGIYQLEGYQDAEANQFSITVADVPKGVCEPLLDKAIIEYKVRVNPSVNEKGKLYDTLNKDLCRDNNFMVFYFGDTTDLCNPKEDGYTPCTTNSDCCGGEFCWFINTGSCYKKNLGQCKSVLSYGPVSIKISGKTWTHSNSTMNWWSAQNWCESQGLKLVNRTDIGCKDINVSSCSSVTVQSIQSEWNNIHWLEEVGNSCHAYYISFEDGYVAQAGWNGSYFAKTLCH